MINKHFLLYILMTGVLFPSCVFAQNTNETTQESVEPEGVLAPYSETEDDTDENEKKQLADVDFNTIESFGILEQAAGQGLGRQFYSNSKRSVVKALIAAMPNSNWTVMEDLGNQVLLTAANTESLANDVTVDPAAGDDLLTLRIQKLMERGFTREAYALYTRLNVAPYNEKLARLGLLSMFANGQKPLACVEIKTSDIPFKTGPFWQEMDAYCTLSLAGEPLPQKQAIINTSKSEILKKLAGQKDFLLTYAPATFESLSIDERALVIGENKLDISGLTETTIAKIPAEHIQPLLSLANVDNKTKIFLNARGVETGVISPYEFARVYIRIGRKAEKEKKELLDIEHLATLYWKRADTFLPENRVATITEVMNQARAHGVNLLVPFLEEIAKTGMTDSLTLEDLDLIISAYLKAGQEFPAEWLDAVKSKTAGSPEAEKRKESIIIAAALMSGDKGNSPEKLKEIYKILEKPQNSALVPFKNIIENIDSRTGSYAKVRYVYEKDFDSGVNKSYTMPPAALIDQLELSSKNQATGETVLLCNLILQGIKPQTIYPDILANVARSLSEVGLGKQAQRLLAEVVLSVGR